MAVLVRRPSRKLMSWAIQVARRLACNAGEVACIGSAPFFAVAHGAGLHALGHGVLHVGWLGAGCAMQEQCQGKYLALKHGEYVVASEKRVWHILPLWWIDAVQRLHQLRCRTEWYMGSTYIGGGMCGHSNGAYDRGVRRIT
jgi:hypothetical protein